MKSDVRNDLNVVSIILLFVILMEKYGFLGSPLGVCSTELRNLVFSLEYLVSNGRQVLLGGIRLDGSTTPSHQEQNVHQQLSPKLN